MADPGLKYQFNEFVIDVADRQLWKNNTRLNLNTRYLDTLILLVQEQGQLIEKQRLFEEVWSDVVVSDSALTQCIKEIRKQLDDDALDPQFVQTVPRHGYRFIAPVQLVTSAPVITENRSQEAQSQVLASHNSEFSVPALPSAPLLKEAAWLALSGTLGGGLAGIFGGLLYGSALGYTPAGPELGTASILLVALSLNILVGLVGGFGISIGMAGTGLLFRQSSQWSVVGAGLGGLLVGGISKLLGVDAFALLFGQSPDGITGGFEGAALGVALALGAKLSISPRIAFGPDSHWRPVWGAGLGGLVAGISIPLLGGNLMGGSLQLIARSFTDSQLQLDVLGQFFGEVHFGIATQTVLGGLEGLLFGAFVAGAIIAAQRIRRPQSM